MTTYFGFACADSMFPDNADLEKRALTDKEAVNLLVNSLDLVSCVNSSHQATLNAMGERFGVQVQVPEKPPLVNLVPGDVLIVMSVRGLPRLTDRHEYTQEEIDGAAFKFSKYLIKVPAPVAE